MEQALSGSGKSSVSDNASVVANPEPVRVAPAADVEHSPDQHPQQQQAPPPKRYTYRQSARLPPEHSPSLPAAAAAESHAADGRAQATHAQHPQQRFSYRKQKPQQQPPQVDAQPMDYPPPLFGGESGAAAGADGRRRDAEAEGEGDGAAAASEPMCIDMSRVPACAPCVACVRSLLALALATAALAGALHAHEWRRSARELPLSPTAASAASSDRLHGNPHGHGHGHGHPKHTFPHPHAHKPLPPAASAAPPSPTLPLATLNGNGNGHAAAQSFGHDR
jgi:hypothetical protein